MIGFTVFSLAVWLIVALAYFGSAGGIRGEAPEEPSSPPPTDPEPELDSERPERYENDLTRAKRYLEEKKQRRASGWMDGYRPGEFWRGGE